MTLQIEAEVWETAIYKAAGYAFVGELAKNLGGPCVFQSFTRIRL